MKEVKKEKIKKIALILCIIVSMFLLATLIGYIIEIVFLGDATYSYIDYLLYLLGYGELDSVNIWFRLFFSIGSLVALTLFSSACTVTWLESRRILKLDNHITIAKDSDGTLLAKLRLNTPKRDIYGAQISLFVNINGKSFSETTSIAYIPKKQFADAIFPVELNSVIYKYFNESYRNNPNVSELIATVTYSDMLSGTEFTMFEKFYCNDPSAFVFEEVEEEFKKFISKTSFSVDFSSAELLDSKSPDRSRYSDLECFNVNFDSSADYLDGDFQMLYVPIPEVTAWGVFHDMGCSLNIKLSITEGATVEVQIKKNDGSILNCENSNRLTENDPSLTVELSKYKRNTWENIKELCFTVFYKDVNSPDKSAKIIVEDCSFVLPNIK